MILQDIKETKCYRHTHGRTDNMKTVYPRPQTQFAGGINMGHVAINMSLGFPTRSDNNWAVLPQNMARGLKFLI